MYGTHLIVVECNSTQMFQQTLRHNASSLNQSVGAHLDEAQDSLADALFIAEGMGNLTAVRPDILLNISYLTFMWQLLPG